MYLIYLYIQFEKFHLSVTVILFVSIFYIKCIVGIDNEN